MISPFCTRQSAWPRVCQPARLVALNVTSGIQLGTPANTGTKDKIAIAGIAQAHFLFMAADFPSLIARDFLPWGSLMIVRQDRCSYDKSKNVKKDVNHAQHQRPND